MKNLMECHEEWIKTGIMPHVGLCGSLSGKYLATLVEMFTLSKEEIEQLRGENKPAGFWGYGYAFNTDEFNEGSLTMSYTPLRQNVLLLIAAMHDEL